MVLVRVIGWLTMMAAIAVFYGGFVAAAELSVPLGVAGCATGLALVVAGLVLAGAGNEA